MRHMNLLLSLAVVLFAATFGHEARAQTSHPEKVATTAKAFADVMLATGYDVAGKIAAVKQASATFRAAHDALIAAQGGKVGRGYFERLKRLTQARSNAAIDMIYKLRALQTTLTNAANSDAHSGCKWTPEMLSRYRSASSAIADAIKFFDGRIADKTRGRFPALDKLPALPKLKLLRESPSTACDTTCDEFFTQYAAGFGSTAVGECPVQNERSSVDSRYFEAVPSCADIGLHAVYGAGTGSELCVDLIFATADTAVLSQCACP